MTQKRGRILIVEAPYYTDIADMLAAGAIAELDARGVDYERFTVPGALEIPAVISAARESFDGFVALGCVIRGQTSHYDIVAGESARALMDLTIGDNLAIGNGILTTDTMDQARVRADPQQKNKGRDAVQACLAVIDAKRKFAGS
tara:strand:+ start:91 stop:525 length:435 start_codon:yes stop_codon:yes gene_type:complete